MIRAIPSNASDNVYCTLLAHSAIHGAMAGYCGFTVGPVNNRHCYIPIKVRQKFLFRILSGNMPVKWFYSYSKEVWPMVFKLVTQGSLHLYSPPLYQLSYGRMDETVRHQVGVWGLGLKYWDLGMLLILSHCLKLLKWVSPRSPVYSSCFFTVSLQTSALYMLFFLNPHVVYFLVTESGCNVTKCQCGGPYVGTPDVINQSA